MNQQAILQSNLLDIIFENRNKDYGAYKLRKSYGSHLTVAVFSTIGLALGLSLVLSFENTSAVFARVHPGNLIPATIISNFYRLSKPGIKKIAMHQGVVKSISTKIPDTDQPPMITSDNINTFPATPAEIQPSFAGTGIPGMDLVPGADGDDKGSLNGDTAATAAKLPEPDKSIPVAVAEIMPQYPGGIQALLSFLKKNIHSPGTMEEGEEVIVKIEFVVNYNGNLESLVVMKSGGGIFDNEVLRVLKKMPLWIPGKSKGKNVSVYYTLPVKFANTF